MALPTYRASGTVANLTASGTVALPAGIQADDILLLQIETANQAVTVSNQAGGTWTEVTDSPQGTGTGGTTTATRLTVFWSRYNGTQTAPTISDSGDHQIARIHAFVGCKTSGNPWNVTAGNIASSSTVTVSIPGDTTTAANCLVVLMCSIMDDAQNFGATWTNADLQNITVRQNSSGTAGNDGRHIMVTGEKVSAGAYGTTANELTAASVQGRMSIALEGAATAHILTAEAGSYAATGVAAGLLVGHLLAAASGSYAVTGTDASLERGYAVAAESGSYAVTGQDATLTYTPANNYLIVADPGSYAVSGQDASLLHAKVATVDAGSYAVTGTDASLLANHAVVADAGSYATTGTDASLERGYEVVADAGSYTLTGSDVGLLYEPATGYVIGAETGAYATTGTDASLEMGRVLGAASGSYAVTGTDAGLVYIPPADGIAIHSATVAIVDAHTGTGEIVTRHGTSIMDTYTCDNDTGTCDSTHHTADDAPMRYV